MRATVLAGLAVLSVLLWMLLTAGVLALVPALAWLADRAPAVIWLAGGMAVVALIVRERRLDRRHRVDCAQLRRPGLVVDRYGELDRQLGVRLRKRRGA